MLRYGFKTPIVAGLALFVASLLLFARAPVDGSYAVDVFGPTMLLGLGAGIAFNPLLLAAMGDVDPSQAGLASGVVNTAFMMGGALGLAILASLAAIRTDNLVSAGDGEVAALNAGYHLAFLLGAIFALAGAVLAVVLFRPHASVEPAPAAQRIAVEG